MASQKSLKVNIHRQPTEDSCGPTCLHAIYEFHDIHIDLSSLVKNTPRLSRGGMLGVHLGLEALKDGFDVSIYSYNLKLFDPSWKTLSSSQISDKLQKQAEAKEKDRLKAATKAYRKFLALGGLIQWEELSSSLIEKLIDANTPLIAGLSATYLYQAQREYFDHDKGKDIDDDILGYSCGHFVIISGYTKGEFVIHDPYIPNPFTSTNTYTINKDRVINAILLGILTYDANLIIVKPKHT